MTAIVPFEFEGIPVRVVAIDGEPWWVARDVLTVLGLSNATEALRGLDQDEFRDHELIDTLGRRQPNARIVSESGLYSLILRSRKPQAKQFKRWITREVIPSIRRTGGYGAASPVPAFPDMATPEGRRAVAAALLAAADREIELTAQVAELEPKARAHDRYLAVPDGARLIRNVAKLLNWKEKDLRTFLVDERLIFRRVEVCGTARWDFYAAHAAHFGAVEHAVTHSWGACTHYTLFVTPRGVDLIERRIADRG